MKKTYLAPAMIEVCIDVEGMMALSQLDTNNTQEAKLDAGDEGEILTQKFEGEGDWK